MPSNVPKLKRKQTFKIISELHKLHYKCNDKERTSEGNTQKTMRAYGGGP